MPWNAFLQNTPNLKDNIILTPHLSERKMGTFYHLCAIFVDSVSSNLISGHFLTLDQDSPKMFAGCKICIRRSRLFHFLIAIRMPFSKNFDGKVQGPKANQDTTKPTDGQRFRHGKLVIHSNKLRVRHFRNCHKCDFRVY